MKSKIAEKILSETPESTKGKAMKYGNSKAKNDDFFSWWEEFTELAYSKNLEILSDKDNIRDKWYKKENYSIEEAIKNFTR